MSHLNGLPWTIFIVSCTLCTSLKPKDISCVTIHRGVLTSAMIPGYMPCSAVPGPNGLSKQGKVLLMQLHKSVQVSSVSVSAVQRHDCQMYTGTLPLSKIIHSEVTEHVLLHPSHASSPSRPSLHPLSAAWHPLVPA